MSKGKNKTSPPSEILRSLAIFRAADAIAAGVSQPTLSRLAADGSIVRSERGLYYHPGADLDPSEIDFAIACIKFGPRSLIGGLTSLFRHGLIPQVPDRIWVVVPSHVKSENGLYRCLRTQHEPTVGIDEHSHYRIANVERSLIEGLQFATKIGLQTVLAAIRKALAEQLTTEKKLHVMATQLGAESAFAKFWEAIATE